ncbi:capsular biosynthesis protein [Chrysochromulina tobinii]|uniref:Capsular biosynthesis protein n=1 Tax=Chrysochromulina tobinii TaxID=1460289 RepID=A0A0M0LP91_9EUKA|nr:capsular biosynthesis protein [Chrysochromulina tobinii]|eukprot:KOO52859.1 capsular biosynthesis protein [Chrysochromulina sp. CCMP291]
MSPDNVAALGLDPPPDSPAGIADPSQLQHNADWYRVEALARYGGVYMDASNVNLLPLETWVNVSSSAVQGFQRPMETRYTSEGAMSEGVLSEMENWAIAAPVDSRFMARWRDHYAEALAEGLDAYVARQDNITMGALKVAEGYLAQHVGWVLTRNELSEQEAPTHLVSSTDEGRPFHFMIEHGL